MGPKKRHHRVKTGAKPLRRANSLFSAAISQLLDNLSLFHSFKNSRIWSGILEQMTVTQPLQLRMAASKPK
jgi:hypothetical protein